MSSIFINVLTMYNIMGTIENLREYEKKLEESGCHEGAEIARRAIKALE